MDHLKRGTYKEYPTQYILRGQDYLLRGKTDKAIKAYQKALRIDQEQPKAHLFLANAWLKKVFRDTKKIGKKKKWLFKAGLHYNKAKKLSGNSIVGEWATRQVKEVDRISREIDATC